MARSGRYLLVGSVLVVLFFSGPSSGSAPDPAEADEAAIRHLEARESAAVLAQDFETLAQIWSERFMVNTPRNIVAPDRSVVLDVFRRGLAHYSAFERRIEHFHLDADIAIVMGGETVRPTGRAARAGETIERRFTHLWKREREGWRLYARHANIIPPPTGVQRAAVDGAELHYIATGSGDPVVLIHGSLADYGYWEYSNQVAPLAAEHRVIAYSRRYNHPNLNPTGPPDHSAVIEAQDLAGFLDRLGLERVHLVGHSYGFNDLIDGQLERMLPNARRIVIADASHEMFLDFPEVTARAMLEFFSNNP